MNKKNVSLVDKTTYMNILGCIMQQPGLLDKYDNIVEDDFNYRIAKVVLRAIYEIRSKATNITTISSNNIETQISLYPAIYQQFTSHGGLDFLADCVEYGGSMLNQFEECYQRLKKLALLRVLSEAQYDISYYYKEDYDSMTEEKKTVERFDNASVDDILNHIEGNFQQIKDNFMRSQRVDADAAFEIDELFENLKQCPNVGPDLSGDWFNTAVRGARPGCFYLKSAASGTGKSRTSVFDACKLCYPIHYSLKDNAFVQEYENGVPRDPRKVLFIVTEMDNSEIQTIILAYLSRVNEEKIITGHYDIGTNEEWRVMQAKEIMKKYIGYFVIESVSDPNLNNVTAIIKRHATVNKVQYIFYDYIHSTPSLLAQFSASKVREDRH